MAPAFPFTVFDGAVLGYSGLDIYWSDNLFLDQILDWFDQGPVSQPWVPNTFGYQSSVPGGSPVKDSDRG